ncbi:helitron_like_N domain-containing protein [Trichonephila inaurata madagascariensis]|uniref:Helitron_like_N domain-containing protein n=1 Tax=Trichonephila inaurata madagascariensis TaxID=2747483 RepID=A0A8X6YRV3_9ARAC|nr:helitron_like_N domain-containing protein [Trichonephila inaurata madagascariensis]
MRKSLLIAGGRLMDNPQDFDIKATQRLTEHCPFIVSRHFMYRFNAIMKFMLNKNQVLNSCITDYWWRIEFQNRGSPHVVWVEGYTSFDTEERLHQLNQECSYDLPPETSELHDFIKKSQLHKHTYTCYKNSSKSPTCRFCFPKNNVLKLVSCLIHQTNLFVMEAESVF